MKKNILLIIPAFNEEKNILKTWETIQNFNKKNKTMYDVIVINDGSTDATEEILLEYDIPHIRLLTNLGIGGAVQTGYKYAALHNYDIAIQYDGDGQHDIRYIDKLIKPIVEENIDMVIGSRFIDKRESSFQSSYARRIGIHCISWIIKLKTKNKIYDTTSGFRAVNRRLIQEFSHIYPTEYPEPISTVYALNKKYKIKEIPVSMNERKEGKSSIHTWKKAYYMFNVILTILLLKKGDKHGC